MRKRRRSDGSDRSDGPNPALGGYTSENESTAKTEWSAHIPSIFRRTLEEGKTMRKNTTPVFLVAVLAVSASVALAQKRLIGNPAGSSAVTLLNQSTSAQQHAIFAAFVASFRRPGSKPPFRSPTRCGALPGFRRSSISNSATAWALWSFSFGTSSDTSSLTKPPPVPRASGFLQPVRCNPGRPIASFSARS